MRGLIAAVAITLASVWLPDAANAQAYGCRGSNLSCEDLQYYCSLGDQAPYSIRRFCGGRRDSPAYGPPSDRYPVQSDRRNYGVPRYQDIEPDDEEEQAYVPPPRNNYRELRYYCSLGDQTPYSMRQSCVRFGFW